MISFRFLRALGLVSMCVTEPKLVGVDGFQVIIVGAPPGPSDAESAPPPWPWPWSRSRWSRARTLVDSGGSLMCDASVGSDQSEGEELKMVVDECERIEPKYILRGASEDVRVYVVDEPECVTLEEVLGRGGGEPLSLSSSNEEGVKWPATGGRLNFHAVVFGGLADSAGCSARVCLWMALTVERLDPRL